MKTELEGYIERRNRALLALDRDALIVLAKEVGTPVPENEKVFWAGVHLARIQALDMPETAREESRNWLHRNGFSSSKIQ